MSHTNLILVLEDDVSHFLLGIDTLFNDVSVVFALVHLALAFDFRSKEIFTSLLVKALLLHQLNLLLARYVGIDFAEEFLARGHGYL